MSVKLNARAYEYAKRLINQGKFVADARDAWSEHRPSAQKKTNLFDSTGSLSTENGISA
jgi:hypothetical protein